VTRRWAVPAGLLALAALPAGAAARWQSLYAGPGPRPGPALLYERPPVAPQLTNRRPFRARPILVSGAAAYRGGEFLYQDFLYDDHGARLAPDPTDPRAGGNLFSKPNGTYTYPTDRRYSGDAADLVELRVKPLRRSTLFRITMNTLEDPSLIALTIAIGGRAGHLHEFPHGADVRAPARLFLTVRPIASRLRAELVRAGRPVGGRAPRVRVDLRRRQITLRVSHRQWNPRRRRVRLAAGVGLWDRARGHYLLPRAVADSTHPGGAGSAARPAAFFNVAFRTHEPLPSVRKRATVVTSAAWWRDRAQGTALAGGDISRFHTDVDFGKLRRHVRDERGVPRRGAFDRILASHFEPAQGTDFSQSCIGHPAGCRGQYQARLQPYAIYVPRGRRPRHGYGLTLLLHSRSASYNQYAGSRNQAQLGERGPGSIVISPEARGPDGSYENYAAADVFEAWAEVARRYRLDPSCAAIAGYSMGGIGTFKLASEFPDLFARAQPTVGFEQNPDVLASLRNVPVLMWNNHGDELVRDPLFQSTAAKLDSLGYRYELDAFERCASAGCAPVFPNHLQLAVNDWYVPAAAFLGRARVHRDPPRVTYVLDAARNHPKLRLVGDHAYWVSGLRPRSSAPPRPGGDPEGEIDVISRGFPVADRPASPTTIVGAGTLTGGYLGPLRYTRQYRTWGPAPRPPRRDELDVSATNLAAATIDVHRARVNCAARVMIRSDGPIAVHLAGCGRTVTGG
jgi:predicted esterase